MKFALGKTVSIEAFDFITKVKPFNYRRTGMAAPRELKRKLTGEKCRELLKRLESRLEDKGYSPKL